MEELAFEDVQILDLLVSVPVLLQLAAVVMQLLAVELLFLDYQLPVLLALLLLDMDLLDQRTHKCNQLIHLDQFKICSYALCSSLISCKRDTASLSC